MEKAKRLNYRLKDAKDYKGILRQVELNLDVFNEVNIATALHRLAKIARDSNEKSKIMRDPRLGQLEQKARENMRLFTPQQLSNSAWACATLSYNSMPLLRSIESQALLKLDKFNSQDLTNTIWAYAKLGYKPKQLMAGIAREALSKLYDFNPQGLANTLWAFATLNHYGDQYSDLLTGIATEAMTKIQNFNPQNLANSSWAYARLNYHPGDLLLEKIANAAVAKVEFFKPQELANLIWAMAKLNYRCETLLTSVSYAAERRLHQYNPQNLANTCWAYAILDFHPGPLLTKIIYQAGRCISDFSQQGLSNTVWALAKLQHHPGEAFLAKVGGEASRKITSFSPQGIVNLALAFACFDKYQASLMDAVCAEVDAKIHAFNKQDLDSVNWALARLGHPSKVFEPLQPHQRAGAREVAHLGPPPSAGQHYVLRFQGTHQDFGGQPRAHDSTQRFAHAQMQELTLRASRMVLGEPQHHEHAFLQTESFKIRGESLISGLLDSQDGYGDAKEPVAPGSMREKPEAAGDAVAQAQGQDKGREEQQGYFSMWQTKELCKITN